MDRVINDDIGQVKKQDRFVIENIGNAITHRGDQYIPHIGGQGRFDPNPGFLPLVQTRTFHRCARSMDLVTTFGKLHSTAELFVFMLSHFLSPLFNHTRHNIMFLGDRKMT